MATEAGRLPDWGAETDYSLWKAAALIASTAAPWLGFAALMVWLAPPGAEIIWVVYAVGMFLWGFSGPKTFGFFSLKVSPLSNEHRARVENITVDLAQAGGVPTPTVFSLPNKEPNALLLRKSGPAIALTRGLIESYSRTELESVIAHCLSRQNSRFHRLSLLAGYWGRPWSSLAPKVGWDDDVKAAAITRYPPGLARAIEKAKPVTNRYGPLWFVADSPAHRPVEKRIAALQDL